MSPVQTPETPEIANPDEPAAADQQADSETTEAPAETAPADAPDASAPAQEESALAQLETQLAAHVDEVRSRIAEARSEGATLSQLVTMAVEGRCSKTAVDLFEEDLAETMSNPPFQIMYGTLLFRSGQTQQALETMEILDGLMNQPDLPPETAPIREQWVTATATINLSMGNVDRAKSLWNPGQDTSMKTAAMGLTQQPFLASGLPQQLDLWAATTGRLAFASLIERPEQWSRNQFRVGLADLELGELRDAKDRLQGIIDRFPGFSYRPIVVFYLNALQEKQYSPLATPPEDDWWSTAVPLDGSAPVNSESEVEVTEGEDTPADATSDGPAPAAGEQSSPAVEAESDAETQPMSETAEESTSEAVESSESDSSPDEAPDAETSDVAGAEMNGELAELEAANNEDPTSTSESEAEDSGEEETSTPEESVDPMETETN